MASSKPVPFSPPLFLSPTSGIHKSTFIILHGRGSSAEKFAEPLLSHAVACSPQTHGEERSFQSYFPNSKFVFPTARLLRARAYNRSLTHQWFDMYPLDEYPAEYRNHIQVQGLGEAVRYVHELIEGAVQEVGAENVVLVGLSQGCATVLTSVLLWQGRSLGAVVGMCGWLPFSRSLAEAINEEKERCNERDDVFERDPEAEHNDKTSFQLVTDILREELGLASRETTKNQKVTMNQPILETPVFLGHGTKDKKVPIKNGKDAVSLLQALGIATECREYEGLGHWYSSPMLRDIVTFLPSSLSEP
ncbi:Alpha/Beta hydrolase protein [Pyrenochaeta sp. MPI-SDFR-AT-0127]|nr:Alpha/Beta hydrolase protein [Pyrenochaeta sp. MPI-SDFR-AT-0127]